MRETHIRDIKVYVPENSRIYSSRDKNRRILKKHRFKDRILTSLMYEKMSKYIYIYLYRPMIPHHNSALHGNL